jgi:hypothetical protein
LAHRSGVEWAIDTVFYEDFKYTFERNNLAVGCDGTSVLTARGS